MIIAMRRRVFRVVGTIATMPSFLFTTAAASGWGFWLGGRDWNGRSGGGSIIIADVFAPPSALPRRLLVGRLFSRIC